MELNYSALPPEETLAFGTRSVESSPEALSETATPGVIAYSEAGPDKSSALNYNHTSDEKLLAAARSGDDRAFMELSSRCAASIHRKVARILRNRADVEDAVQEALFKAYMGLDQFRGTCKFSTWLTRITVNSALMQLRRRRGHFEVPLHPRREDDQAVEIRNFPDPSPNAEQLYAKRQAIDKVLHVVQLLPSPLRTIVSEYYGQERPIREAADNLGITLSAAKSRLVRARLAIRTTLETNYISSPTPVFKVGSSIEQGGAKSVSISRDLDDIDVAPFEHFGEHGIDHLGFLAEGHLPIS